MLEQIKLFVFDVDNTITVGDSIWEVMHKECRTWENYGSKYLDEFKAGLFDFNEFARRDARSWANQPRSVLEQAIRKTKIATGFAQLIQQLKQRKIATALVTCTVGQFAEYLAQKFELDYLFANPLVIKNNILTGEIDIQVTGDGKSQVLQSLIKKLELPKSAVAVIGDSQYDVPMFDHAHHTFIIKNSDYRQKAKYFIQDFQEIIDLL